MQCRLRARSQRLLSASALLWSEFTLLSWFVFAYEYKPGKMGGFDITTVVVFRRLARREDVGAGMGYYISCPYAHHDHAVEPASLSPSEYATPDVGSR